MGAVWGRNRGDKRNQGDDAISLSSSPNFYILDEPTNHLDMETIEALAKALNKFKVRLVWLRGRGRGLWSGLSAAFSCFRAAWSWCHTTNV